MSRVNKSRLRDKHIDMRMIDFIAIVFYEIIVSLCRVFKLSRLSHKSLIAMNNLPIGRVGRRLASLNPSRHDDEIRGTVFRVSDRDLSADHSGDHRRGGGLDHARFRSGLGLACFEGFPRAVTGLPG